METNKIIEDLPCGIVRWYPFRKGARLLLLGEDGPIAAMLRDVFGMDVTAAGLDRAGDMEGAFDYAVCVGSLERSSHPVADLAKIREMLAPSGTLLLGMNNRLGLRYFCGDHDPYTGRSFDGIENYSRAQDAPGRMYARSEIEEMLAEAGWGRRKLYSVLPCLEEAVFLYADGQLPREDLTNRLFPSYHFPQALLMEEEPLYRTLADNGMFHSMANAYLIECSMEGKFADALYVTISLERGRENAMVTVVHGDGTATKEAAYGEGRDRLLQLDAHTRALRESGIPVVEGHLEHGRYVMPCIETPVGQVYLKELLYRDRDRFLEAMDGFREAILSSSPIHRSRFTDADGAEGETDLFDIGYIDMVPLNSFFLDGRFVFFDQEFAVENCPVGLVVSRMICTFYAGPSGSAMERILPRDDLFARYGLLEEKQRWIDMEMAFLQKLRSEDLLEERHGRVRRDAGTVAANRRRMDCTEKEYQKRFADSFEGKGNRKIILFGSGRIAGRFLDSYAAEYPVHAICDNSEGKWGTCLHGIEIRPPEFLRQLEAGTYYVVICIKECRPVMRQLEDMGIGAYCVFEPSRAYARQRRPIMADGAHAGKKYHVGYVAGVFDLFHIGHLNLFRRAKAQCDYLIVGVVTDRQVREWKQVEPFIPFEERMEMVRSCRYVDEVREIPYGHTETDVAWRMYRFDVQFSGSDYEHDPKWVAKRNWLEEHGAALVFFPYTESTSSTKLKGLIDRKLL